jgi:hypothetical protein
MRSSGRPGVSTLRTDLPQERWACAADRRTSGAAGGRGSLGHLSGTSPLLPVRWGQRAGGPSSSAVWVFPGNRSGTGADTHFRPSRETRGRRKPPLTWGFSTSGRPDSNWRPSPWQGYFGNALTDSAPIEHHVFAGRMAYWQPQAWAMLVTLCQPCRSGTGAERRSFLDWFHSSDRSGFTGTGRIKHRPRESR